MPELRDSRSPALFGQRRRGLALVLGAALVIVAACGDKGAGTAAPRPSTTPSTVTSDTGAVTTAPTSTTVATSPTVSPDLASLRFDAVVKVDPAIDYTLRGEYLQIDGLETSILETVNSAIESDIETAVGQFEFAVIDIGNVPDTGTGSELDVSSRATALSRNLLSVSTELYQYLEGAAHGGTTVVTHVFDLASGRRLTLDDIFAPSVEHLDRLSALTRAALNDQLDDPSLSASIDDGTKPVGASFSAWTLTENALVIVFQEYQVGPYAIGRQQVELPYDALDGLLAPTFTPPTR